MAHGSQSRMKTQPQGKGAGVGDLVAHQGAEFPKCIRDSLAANFVAGSG